MGDPSESVCIVPSTPTLSEVLIDHDEGKINLFLQNFYINCEWRNYNVLLHLTEVSLVGMDTFADFNVKANSTAYVNLTGEGRLFPCDFCSILNSCLLCISFFHADTELDSYLTPVEVVPTVAAPTIDGKKAPKQKKKVCEVCGRLVGITYYSIHKRLHTGKKLSTCQLCGKHCVTPTTLKVHMKTVHQNQCKTCDKIFNTRVDLNTHEQQVHLNAEFVCKICSKGFLTKHKYQMHMYHRHNARIAVQCNFCQRAFQSRALLRAHLINHHKANKTM